MSIPPAFDQNEWDVRHYNFPSSQSRQNVVGMLAESSQFIESLLETIENADATAADGWQLARVKVEADEKGRRWLDVWLKRQKSTAGQVPLNSPPSHRAA